MKLKDTKLIIGILTCPKSVDRKRAVLNAWANKIPPDVRHHFIYGKNYQQLCDCHTFSDIHVDVPEAYEMLAIKMYEYIKYCVDTYEFDYIVKVDDDSYVDVNKLLEYDVEGDYLGKECKSGGGGKSLSYHIGNCTDDVFNRPIVKSHKDGVYKFCAGGGYILSKRACLVILNSITRQKLDQYHEDYKSGDPLGHFGFAEDRTIGSLLHDSNISPKETGLWSGTKLTSREIPLFCSFNNSIYHPIDAQLMDRLRTPQLAQYHIGAHST